MVHWSTVDYSEHDYPTLNAPSTECSEAVMEREVVEQLRDKALEEGNLPVVRLYDRLLAMFIPESPLVQ